jgi:hypothetical protein
VQEGVGNFSTIDYGIQLGYQIEQVNLMGSLSGRYLLDGRTFHMSRFSYTSLDRTTYQFAAAASVNYHSVRPGVNFSVLFDDYVNDASRPFVNNFLTDEVHFVFGLNFAIRLK